MMPIRHPWTRNVALAVAAMLLLGGCSLTRESPVKAAYLLEPADPSSAARAHPGTIRMGIVNVGAAFRARSFVVRASDLKYESDYYNEFFVPPAVMIGDATARALTIGKLFAGVAPSGGGADAEWVLDAFVSALYADGRDPAKPVAVVAVTYYLSRGTSDPTTPFWSRTYERRVPFTAGGTGSYVNALNAGLGEILAELARDLAAVSFPAK